MTFADEIRNEYFEWLSSLVNETQSRPKQISYRRLLIQLHDTEFTYIIPRDVNRARDGIDLRYRFSMLPDHENLSKYLEGPCSVLEMMIALAISCEESIMDDPKMGNRTGQWFWGMVSNLGLNSMTDANYDRDFVSAILERFLEREYEADGEGGLFKVKHCAHDLRKVEIWYQLCWYLDTIT